jgi:hypothetical protein
MDLLADKLEPVFSGLLEPPVFQLIKGSGSAIHDGEESWIPIANALCSFLQIIASAIDDFGSVFSRPTISTANNRTDQLNSWTLTKS